MTVRAKIFLAVLAALALQITVQDLEAARNPQIPEDVNLSVLPLNVRAAQRGGVQYFETQDLFIKSVDPMHVGYNQNKKIFINDIPQNLTPAEVDFKKPDALGMPGLKFKNGANAGVFEADTYESDRFLVTAYFPLEYNFTDKKFVGSAGGGVNSVVNDAPDAVLCENFTARSRKLILTYPNASLTPLINRIDGANPGCLLNEILGREKAFAGKVHDVISGRNIIVAYKVLNKKLHTTTITMYVLM